MSSAILIDNPARNPARRNPAKGGSHKDLQPWQFFVLAALAFATTATFMTRGQGLTSVILVSVLMGATVLVGLAVVRTVRPLVTSHEDRTAMIGERTRAALEREKTLALRALKELEFDRAMGKLSDEDFRGMSGRLRARATGLMRQLDAGAGYRSRIESDLAERLSKKEAQAPSRPELPARAHTTPDPKGRAYTDAQDAAPTCLACSTANDPDARFCKQCGAKL